MTEYDPDEEIIEDEADEPEESSFADDADSSVGQWRSWMLLLIVLIIGAILLGVFLASRSVPLPPPTMKPPWLV